MTQVSQPTPLLSLSISRLSQFDYCPKRCKIECFKQYEEIPESTGKAMVTGTHMHSQYTRWMNQTQLGIDREIIINHMIKQMVNEAFQKQLDNILIRGIPDEFKVVYNEKDGQKYFSLIELKTTSKKFFWTCEIRSAALQLQLYIWLVKSYFEEIGYKINYEHYVEVYSQNSGFLLSQIIVHEDPDIEAKIRYIIKAFQGQAPMTIPQKSACKICPKIVKLNCSWREGIENGY